MSASMPQARGSSLSSTSPIRIKWYLKLLAMMLFDQNGFYGVMWYGICGLSLLPVMPNLQKLLHVPAKTALAGEIK